ncbi:MAG: hypothetical protein EOP47_26995, partial [Sphingobacteriaceae bacterium]
TLSGLILFLGFESRADFDSYEKNGAFAGTLKRGRLRIEAEYEKKLHFQSPTGAIFALKKLGWDDRTNEEHITSTITTLKIEVVNTGFVPVSSENQVRLEQ